MTLTSSYAMDDSTRQPRHSPPSPFQLPSFSSISSGMSHQNTASRGRRESGHDASIDVVQAMRQQINARDQSISILRSEQERIQSRYEALETKSQVMDHEVAALTEEKTELRKRVNSLINQVERLNRDKEGLQSQSQADAAQWRQIMSMSSRLQMQSVEESRRYNAEREAWSSERQRLENRIIELSGGVLHHVESAESAGSPAELRRTLTVASMSNDQLRQEVIGLRERCKELEELLTAVVKESASIERTGVLLREIKQRVISCESRRDEEQVTNACDR